jgi:hypothetical protein
MVLPHAGRAMGAAAAVLLAACAPAGLLRYEPDAPPLATLPAILAGVRDRRQDFAHLFQRELQAGTPAGRVEDWLHGAAAQPVGAAPWMQAMDARYAARRGATVVLLVPGPRNDGQVLAADAVLPGSSLLAVARSDHWDLALPRDRHPDALVRAMTSGRAWPREALFRALVQWATAEMP